MFPRILIAVDGSAIDAIAFRHAFMLAQGSDASVSCLVVMPDTPKALRPHRPAFEALLRQQVANIMAPLVGEPGHASPGVPVDIQWGERFATAVIRKVLSYDIELVVKAAARATGEAGFDAVDMELLRKCPCAVLLARPCDRPLSEARIGVAIDPDPAAQPGLAVARNLLRMAAHLAQGRQETVPAISAWDFPLERSLRGSGFLSVPEAEIASLVRAEADSHRAAFEGLVAEAGSDLFELHHLRGSPGTVIPAAAADLGIDILLMGTLGRTGLPGLLMGNTAENILNRLSCSLVALKPPGFVSPIKLM